jgi:hypothetical protein
LLLSRRGCGINQTAIYLSEAWQEGGVCAADIDSRLAVRRTIERLFETVEANASCAVVAVMTSFAVTGCLRFFWE